jgi:hypothetical protein
MRPGHGDPRLAANGWVGRAEAMLMVPREGGRTGGRATSRLEPPDRHSLSRSPPPSFSLPPSALGQLLVHCSTMHASLILRRTPMIRFVGRDRWSHRPSCSLACSGGCRLGLGADTCRSSLSPFRLCSQTRARPPRIRLRSPQSSRHRPFSRPSRPLPRRRRHPARAAAAAAPAPAPPRPRRVKPPGRGSALRGRHASSPPAHSRRLPARGERDGGHHGALPLASWVEAGRRHPADRDAHGRARADADEPSPSAPFLARTERRRNQSCLEHRVWAISCERRPKIACPASETTNAKVPNGDDQKPAGRTRGGGGGQVAR